MSQLKQTVSQNVWFWPYRSSFVTALMGFFFFSLLTTLLTVVADPDAGLGRVAVLLGAILFMAIVGTIVMVLFPKIAEYDLRRKDRSITSGFLHMLWGFAPNWEPDDVDTQFSELRSLSSSQDSSGGGSPPSGDDGGTDNTDEEHETFMRYLAARVRETKKARDKMFGMGAFVTIGLFAFWIISNQLLGTDATLKETYVLPWWGLFLCWFLIIATMPRTLIPMIFFVMVGLNLGIHIFGEAILPVLPHFIMLPFFYGFMMMFMFGSIMLPNLQAQKFYRPGDARWEVPKGSMVGQKEARAKLDNIMRMFYARAMDPDAREAPRGIVLRGPPGVGKTLYMMELAANYNLPFAFADATAFVAPFAGFGQLLVLVFRMRTEALAREYRGCVIFVDEGETVFAARDPSMRVGGAPGTASSGIEHLWDIFSVDRRGYVAPGCSVFKNADTYKRAQATNDFMMMGAPGGGGGSTILPWLTWMDGTSSPPMKSVLLRRMGNNLIDGAVAFLLVPSSWTLGYFGKAMRFAPAEVPRINLLFTTATNRPEEMDRAIVRKGRMGEIAIFTNPDLFARIELIEHYTKKLIKEKELHPDLGSEERIKEFARATNNMSHSTIEAILRAALDARIDFIGKLERIEEQLAYSKTEGASYENAFEQLAESDQQHWLLHKDRMEEDGWDERLADWDSLMEARNLEEHGAADLSRTTPEGKLKIVYHEFLGHYIHLKEFLAGTVYPTVLSIVPRGGKSLGRVAFQPIEERNQMTQSDYEGLLRVHVGSLIAENFCFGEHGPGVVGDLEGATGITCYMTGRLAMMPRGCKQDDDDWNYFAKIGRTLIQVPDSPMLSQEGRGFIDKVLSKPEMEERVAVFLGQAAVDAYRTIRANAFIVEEENLVEDLLKLGEFSGSKNEDLWNILDAKIISLKDLEGDDLTRLPDRIFNPESPFYTRDERKTEMEEVLAS